MSKKNRHWCASLYISLLVARWFWSCSSGCAPSTCAPCRDDACRRRRFNNSEMSAPLFIDMRLQGDEAAGQEGQQCHPHTDTKSKLPQRQDVCGPNPPPPRHQGAGFRGRGRRLVGSLVGVFFIKKNKKKTYMCTIWIHPLNSLSSSRHGQTMAHWAICVWILKPFHVQLHIDSLIKLSNIYRSIMKINIKIVKGKNKTGSMSRKDLTDWF